MENGGFIGIRGGCCLCNVTCAPHLHTCTLYQAHQQAHMLACTRTIPHIDAATPLRRPLPLTDVGKAFEKYYDNPMAYTNIPADKISFAVGMICVLVISFRRAPCRGMHKRLRSTVLPMLWVNVLRPNMRFPGPYFTIALCKIVSRKPHWHWKLHLKPEDVG